MRVLILGVTGMLGHKLYQVLGSKCDVAGTITGNHHDIARYGIFEESKIIPGIDAQKLNLVESAIEQIHPDVVINAIGIVKSLEKEKGVLQNIAINSLFPHQLYQLCSEREIRLIHISTDCVFSGRKGSYREEDISDSDDIYGKTKYLGEVGGKGALTIRTSFIGRDLASSRGLVEWFLSNREKRINGFTKAIYTGFPTLHLSRIIGDLISGHRDLHGVYHVASQSISKYELLVMIKDAIGLSIEIEKYLGFSCDRSLDATLFNQITSFSPLPWKKMIAEFAEDARQYQNWRAE